MKMMEAYPELKKIYDEAIAIELPEYIPGGENKEAKRFIELRNQYEDIMKDLDASYEVVKANPAVHYNIVNWRCEIDKKLKDYVENMRKTVRR